MHPILGILALLTLGALLWGALRVLESDAVVSRLIAVWEREVLGIRSEDADQEANVFDQKL